MLYYMALAARASGDGTQARELAQKAANFNGLNINYAYVKEEAQQLLAEL